MTKKREADQSMKNSKISPSRVVYIKLGDKGRWEEECISRGILRLGYRETPHDLCLEGQWSAVLAERQRGRKNSATASGDTAQIRTFYTADASVLWLTFWKNCLWWCFSEPTVTLVEDIYDSYKERPAIGGWKNTDINGGTLLMSQLNGSLLAMRGFRGTICSVKEKDYAVNKINGIQSKEVEQARQALSQLEMAVESVVPRLTWKDFELLIDLIFRQAGWQRTSEVGGTKKDIDFDLLSPITEEKIGVQVKAKCTRAIYEEYRDNRLKEMQGFTRFYFAVHTPSGDLTPDCEEDGEVALLLPAKIASLAVQYGLSRWVLDHAK